MNIFFLCNSAFLFSEFFHFSQTLLPRHKKIRTQPKTASSLSNYIHIAFIQPAKPSHNPRHITLHRFRSHLPYSLNLPRLKSRGSQPRILTDSDTLGYPRSSYGSYICYAPTTRSPSFRIFIAAFTSLSCTAPHCGQTHSRTDKSLVPEFI